jgi:YegS/Rv2252/BmrU family lipid kinase
MTVRAPAVVANPAKLADPAADRARVTDALCRAGLPPPAWLETTEHDPGRGATRQALADGADLVLVLGGDGTVRACAGVLAGTTIPLALLPAGTGNLLAKNLGIPADLDAAAAVAADGTHRRIDVVELEGEPFVVMGGCGFDARVFEETSDDLKKRVGWLAYVSAGMRALRTVHAVGLTYEVDGRSGRTDAVGVVVGNVGTLAGGVPLFPDAEPDDGLLDVAVLTPTRRRDWVGLVVRVLARRRPHPYQLTRLLGREVRLRWDEEVPVEADGEVLGPARTARFAVRPAALTVCLPEPRAASRRGPGRS